MLDSLADGHSSFSDPETNRRRQERSYAGIGVRLRRGTAPAPAVIVEVFRDTPASASGLKPGDRLVEVDGQPLAGLTLDQVVNRVRGPKGSEVRLTVDRPNVGQLSFTLTRAEVSVRPVEAALVGPIGYIRIRTFSDDRPIAEFVAEALRNGNARGAQGWILDLRGNGGGLLRHIQQTAGLWLGNKPIGIEIDRQRRRTTLTAEGRPLSVNQPLVVLVDRESSSGAEILAAALREHGVAHLVGTTTAGSVGVAQSLDLPDGSSVQLTVRRFLSSTGAPIDRVGVAPDEFVELTEQDLANGDDPQLERAAQYLQQKLGG
jgi:carboxyl-terminal processing protease